MENRIAIQISGAAGLGIKTSGLVLAKALKRSGFGTFGYTEYPSLIKGGNNIFQIDISDRRISSASRKINIFLALDQNSIKLHLNKIEEGGILIYDRGTITLSAEALDSIAAKKIEAFGLNLLELSQSVGGTGIMKNTVTLGALWSVLNLNTETLFETMKQYFNKTEEILSLNIKCAQAGYEEIKKLPTKFKTNFKPNPNFAKDLFISGNEAIGLGAISAGVRLYSSYPMTPASSILSYLATEGTKYGMIVKQAEDEITAVNMVVGASYAGTRAMCGTSGGGFDLMTEAISLAGITETPLVVVLAQRPGPATGVPTWTAQGDLNLAIYGGHGEFPRIVIAVSDPSDAYYLTTEAHNLADEYQTPVIILTDKHIAESYFMIEQYDESKVTINRGKVSKVSNTETDSQKLRYDFSEDGISERWYPGDKIATFLANSDEHTPKGYSTEEANEIQTMYEKRLKKSTTIQNSLPDAQLYKSNIATQQKNLVIGWGSTKATAIDAQYILDKTDNSFDYLHYTYIWPIKTELLNKIKDSYENIIIVDGNATAQFANILKSNISDLHFNSLLKFDGRPFFVEEMVNKLNDLFVQNG